MEPQRIYVGSGQRVTLELPYSEVCVHMGVAGRRMQVEMTPTEGAQLYTLEGSKFSFPILPKKAGLHRDGQGYYAYPNGI